MCALALGDPGGAVGKGVWAGCLHMQVRPLVMQGRACGEGQEGKEGQAWTGEGLETGSSGSIVSEQSSEGPEAGSQGWPAWSL